MVNMQRVQRIKVLIYCFLTFTFFTPLVLIVTLFFKILRLEQSVYAYMQEQSSVSQPAAADPSGMDRYVLEPKDGENMPFASTQDTASEEEPTPNDPESAAANGSDPSANIPERTDETIPFSDGGGVPGQPAAMPGDPGTGAQSAPPKNPTPDHPFTGA